MASDLLKKCQSYGFGKMEFVMSELELLTKELFEKRNILDIKFWPGDTNKTSPDDFARATRIAIEDHENGNSTPISRDF